MEDVKAIYHRIKFQLDDVHALRFLWCPDCYLSRKREEYHMTVHLFGVVWSGCCANYGLQRTTQDNSGDFDPLAVSTVAVC